MDKPDLNRGLRMAVRWLLDTFLTETQARRVQKYYGVGHPYAKEMTYTDIGRDEDRDWTSVRESIEQVEPRLEGNIFGIVLTMMSQSRELEWAEPHQCLAGCCTPGDYVECSYPYGWRTRIYYAPGRGWVEERRWGRMFVGPDGSTPLSQYNTREETTVPTKPVETVTSEWQNQNVENHEGFTPMSTVAARMSGRPSWHDTRRQHYNRNEEIADLIADEMRYDAVVLRPDEDGVLREKSAENLGPGYSGHDPNHPGHDGYESDRYNPDDAAK